MKLFDIIGMTLRNLFRRKLRTFLTIMGVVIGTSAIVVMFSLGVAMDAALTQSLSEMGDLTQIQIYNYSNSENADALILDDAAMSAIAALPHVEVATPFWRPNDLNMRIVSGKKDRYMMYAYNIMGVYPGALEKLGFEMLEGDTLKEGDPDFSIIFGEEAGYEFQDTKAKGQRRYNWKQEQPDGSFNEPYVDLKDNPKILLKLPPSDATKYKELEFKPHIAGIMKGDYSKGYESMSGVFMEIDDLKLLMQAYNKENKIKPKKINGKVIPLSYQEAKVKVTDISYVEEVETAIKAMGYETNSMESMRKPMQEQIRQQQLFLGGLGAISLLVATFGIVNTMIMSIYERTREIGVMKVLGCKLGNIMSSFLMEASFIGFLGGCIGVGASYGFSWIFNTLNAMSIMGGGSGVGMGNSNPFGNFGNIPADIPPVSVIPLWLVAFALVFSTCVGLFAGFYPAYRATRISALEAIKHE